MPRRGQTGKVSLESEFARWSLLRGARQYWVLTGNGKVHRDPSKGKSALSEYDNPISTHISGARELIGRLSSREET